MEHVFIKKKLREDVFGNNLQGIINLVSANNFDINSKIEYVSLSLIRIV